jgi:glycosyltransferase involved in cell wall biosynthesis
MKSGVPVIGAIPNLIPEWMNENNGIWIQDLITIPDLIADFIQNWLEDNVSDKIYEGGILTSEKYSSVEIHEKKITKLFENLIESRLENFESEYNKQTQEQNV